MGLVPKIFGFLLVVVVFFQATGCNRSVATTTTTSKQLLKDSVFLQETVKVDTIVIPGDSIRARIALEYDSTGKVKPQHIKIKSDNQRASVELIVTEDTIDAIAVCDEVQQLVLSLNRVLEKYSDNQLFQDRSYREVKRKKGFFHQFGLIAFFVLLALIGYQIFKKTKFLL